MDLHLRGWVAPGRRRGDAYGVTLELEFNIAAGRAMRRIRRHLELSQEQVAAGAGLSAKHVGEIERGHKDPRLRTVAAIVERGLGITFGEFAHVCEQLRAGANSVDLGPIALREPMGVAYARRPVPLLQAPAS